VTVHVSVAVVAWAGVIVISFEAPPMAAVNGRVPVTVAEAVARIVMSAGAMSIVGSDETNEIVISEVSPTARFTMNVSAD
jgi:hypothetical protein